MKKADLYVTPNNQQRLVLGFTPAGDVAFATRGGNTAHDYDRCQLQPPGTFTAEGTFSHAVSTAESTRVDQKFANYIAANGIR